MNSSEILMSIVLLSAVAIGMGTFFVSTASIYSVDTTQLEDFSETFNQYDKVDVKLKQIKAAIENIDIANPLTWGNAVTLIINIFTILFEVPGLIHVMLTETVTMSGILPLWVVSIVELIILLLIVFGAISGINKWRS